MILDRVTGRSGALLGLLLLVLPAGLVPAPADAGEVETSAGVMRIDPVVTGLNEPWAIGFLPDGSILLTERGGRLLRLASGAVTEVGGLPEIYVGGQGGLLDVLVPRDFARSRTLWLSFAAPVGGGAASAAGRGRLAEDFSRFESFETVFTGTPARGGRHFGARLVEAASGEIFLATGERGTGPSGRQAQDPANTLGKVIRIEGGAVAPPRDPGWAPGVISLGHRNIQGAALGPDGRLYVAEHGARGGDEINRVEAGRNYGWPVISYGRDYNGAKIGEGQARPGMEQPLHYWDPSIAPSGLMIHSGRLVPAWKGSFFTGSLNSDFISRLDPARRGGTGWAEERIASPETGRVRDIREGPDGAIWFLSVTRGALYRMVPR